MDQHPPTDADLVSATLAGKREAFGQLYDRYARMVRAVVAGVSADWPGGDDMVQETFLRGYRNLARLRDPDRFGPWIVGIARQIGRERRRTLRRDRHEFRDSRPWLVESPASDGKVRVDDRDELSFVLQNVSQLEERERIAIHAFYLEQQHGEKAAELLGLSRSGFYALLQRAVARLAVGVRPGEHQERTVKK
jgi:RNA polymerase sigma-70 factor (ECF subfamily)